MSASIVGRVLGRRGQALVGATVMIAGSSPAHSDLAALTGQQGRFRFSGLEPGRYELVVNAGGTLQTHVVTVGDSGQEEVEIRVNQ